MQEGFIDTLHKGDARQMKTLLGDEREGSLFDVTITSPPYWNQKDYGYEKQLGWGQTYDKYLGEMEGVFGDTYFFSKENATFWLVADSLKRNGQLIPLPFHLAEAATRSGWRLQDVIIWDKKKTLPWSRKGQLRNTFEYVFFFTKGENYKYYSDRIKEPSEIASYWKHYPERYNPNGRTPTNIWSYQIPTQGSWSSSNIKHACPFPPELVERMLLLTTDPQDVVFDPFAGTGTVLALAHAMGRHYIGIEKSASYAEMFSNVVINEIRELWLHQREKRRAVEIQRQVLNKTVKILRQLKYPREMARHLIKKEPPHIAGPARKIEYILALSTGDYSEDAAPKHRFAKMSIQVAVSSNMETDALELLTERVKAISLRRPFSKYGIDVDLNVVKSNVMELDPAWWVYLDGNFNHYAGDVLTLGSTMIEWNKLPPVVSNLKVEPYVYTVIDKPSTDLKLLEVREVARQVKTTDPILRKKSHSHCEAENVY